MQMMYDIVAQELNNSGLEDAHPQDYLNFYCLGNREECHEEESMSISRTSSSGAKGGQRENGVVAENSKVINFVTTDFCAVLHCSIVIHKNRPGNQGNYIESSSTGFGFTEIWTVHGICTCQGNDRG